MAALIVPLLITVDDIRLDARVRRVRAANERKEAAARVTFVHFGALLQRAASELRTTIARPSLGRRTSRVLIGAVSRARCAALLFLVTVLEDGLRIAVVNADCLAFMRSCE